MKPKDKRMNKYYPWLLLALVFLNSCSMFFGNIKPIEEKSKDYHIFDLAAENPDWVRMNPNGITPGEPGNADLAFQSKKFASIISISSACRHYSAREEHASLKELTQELLMGVTNVTFIQEKRFTVANSPSIQTTIKGKIDGEEMMLQTVVIHRKNCVYDFMYVARPEHFAQNEATFLDFVMSFRLK